MQTKRYVILDRDGTINMGAEELGLGKYILHHQQLKLQPYVQQALRKLRSEGFGLVVVTNQSPIAHGLLTPTGLQSIHDRLRSLLKHGGVSLDAIYHCPHYYQDCQCRKPKPGMILQAAGDLGFDPSTAYFIGDDIKDIQAGKAAGTRTILVKTGHGAEFARNLSIVYPESQPDFVAANMAEAAQFVLASSEGGGS